MKNWDYWELKTMLGFIIIIQAITFLVVWYK
jgi:hypothetical protein